ncbi:MAG: DUF5115 domain-containing protein [Cytophagaceae bacterium]|jgi:hypothetical protein|nr:DUF5115 domain-containing protein [Cytophagaceae bacterium]
MKKRYFYLATLFAIAFSACTDDIRLTVAPPQSYPQESQQVIDGFTIVAGDAFSSAIVLTADDTLFQIVKATATPALKDGASVIFRTEISDTQKFTSVVELPVTSADNAATATSSDLDAAVKALFGSIAPLSHNIYLRNWFYILDGTSASMMPTPATFGPYSVTPYSNIQIETAYYLIGDVNGWNMDNLDTYKFSHSGQDVYDDPVFSILLQMPAGNFKIVPQSSKDDASWAGVLGNPTDQNTALEGTLGTESAGYAGAMNIEEAQWVKITLNMMEYKYTIELLGNPFRQLYVPGGHQGWNPATAPIVFSSALDWKFDGYVYMEAGNEFKFTTAPSWDGTAYGAGAEEGVLSTAPDAGNLNVAETGFYRLTADLSGEPATYTATATVWGLIGDATAGSWDNSTEMALNTATGEWTVTAELTAGAFKFRANNEWVIDLGGDVNNLTYGGDNIPVAEAGTYVVTLKLGDATAYSCTVVKQ